MRIEIEHILVFDLKPYEHNPRKNIDAIKVVKESIREHGFLQPILINQDNVICAGHTRWQAAKDLGIKKIPCIRKEMTQAEFINFNLADNKTGQIAKWDKKKLNYCMGILKEISNIKVAGFTDSDIDKIFGHNHNENHSSSVDFGDAGEVDDEIDEESLVKTMSFKFNGLQYKKVKSKLCAIKNEHGYDNLALALLRAIEPYQGLTETRIRKGNK